MSYPLPPDTRSVGSPDPPGDMNKIVDALLGMGEASYVKPSGDTTGVTDQANIQALINAGTPVSLQPGNYRISTPLTLANGTVITGVSGGGFGGAFPPGVSQITLVNGSNCSMIVAPSTANYWRLANLLLSANGANQSGPAQTGTTGAAIHVADGGSPAELQADLSGVYVEDSYNDALYIGVNRRMLRARWCKFNDAGLNGSTVYGAGNGITCAYSDHVFETCSIGNSRHHGIYLVPGNAASIRVTNCDLFTNGQDWASVTPTTVAAGSNGQAVTGLTGAGTLSVASVTGFPSSGSLLINVGTGPVVVSYTGTSAGQFNGVAVSATQGNQGGTLATGQGVYLLGGDAIHIGSGSAGIWLAGNSLDRNQGCGVFAETSLQSVNIAGNRFSSNSAIADGLLPHVMIVSPGLRVSLAANGMEPLAGGFTNRCTWFVQGNGSGSWFDTGNSWVAAALSTGKYTNNLPGISPFSNGSLSAYPASGLTGAVAASRYAGATTSGAPAAGTFAAGDFVADQAGKMWACTAAGTPGTWAEISSSSFTPLDAGYIAWSFDPGLCAGSSLPTTGIVQLIRINLRAAASITNVITGISIAGSGLTGSQNFLGLYAGQTAGAYTAGQLIGTSADQTAAFGSTGLKTAALAGGPFSVPAGFCWAAILAAGTTTPSFNRSTSLSGGAVNAGFAAATARFANVTGAQTSLPSSITPASNNLSGVGFWAAVS